MREDYKKWLMVTNSLMVENDLAEWKFYTFFK